MIKPKANTAAHLFKYEIWVSGQMILTTANLAVAIKASLERPGSRIEMANTDVAEVKALAEIPEEEIMWKMIPVWVKCEEEADEVAVQARGRPCKRKHSELESLPPLALRSGTHSEEEDDEQGSSNSGGALPVRFTKS